ncbi:MAG: hypothetical protein J6A78_06800 [Clostridia bacterium]|nr:hypothetical protein [Clostridia bacterium]MBO5359010.1 hypothetical protein [Clostridia bacterium]
MLKKLLISVLIIAVMLITAVSALEIGDDFYLYGRDNKELSKALSMSEAEITSYCTENYITALAVNKNNTKQIREITRGTEFSKTVKNLAVLKNDEILALTYQLCGIEKVKGKVIEKDAYKYLKIEVKGKDSGGEYILTQYITVKNSKTVTLSFYTSNGEDTSYTDKIFNSQFSNIGATKTWLTVALAFVLGLCAVLSVMIVRDLKPPKREEVIEQ